jgi:hypothetical protein
VPLVVRRITWPPDNKPSDEPDFQVFDGATAVGRIYKTTVPGGTKWRWSVYGLAIRSGDVPRGWADSFEAAKAQFRGAWKWRSDELEFPRHGHGRAFFRLYISRSRFWRVGKRCVGRAPFGWRAVAAQMKKR